MNEAFNRVREMRPIVAPNLIFMSQLMDFEGKAVEVSCSASFNAGDCEASVEKNLPTSESNSKKVSACNWKRTNFFLSPVIDFASSLILFSLSLSHCFSI